MPQHRILTALASLGIAALALTGCATGGDQGGGAAPDAGQSQAPADASAPATPLPPNAIEVPFGNDPSVCSGSATLHSSSADWQNWPEGSQQFRLEAPAGEPQWSLTATSLCTTRATAEASNPNIDWTIDGYLSSAADVCPEPIEVAIDGFEARLCEFLPGHEYSLVHQLIAMSDTHLVMVNISITPDLRGTDGTDPENPEQARPMGAVAAEALQHTTIRIDG